MKACSFRRSEEDRLERAEKWSVITDVLSETLGHSPFQSTGAFDDMIAGTPGTVEVEAEVCMASPVGNVLHGMCMCLAGNALKNGADYLSHSSKTYHIS